MSRDLPNPTGSSLKAALPLVAFALVCAGIAGVCIGYLTHRGTADRAAAVPTETVARETSPQSTGRVPPSPLSGGTSAGMSSDGESESMGAGMSEEDQNESGLAAVESALTSTANIEPAWTPEESKPKSKAAPARGDHSWLPRITSSPGSARDPRAVASAIDAILNHRIEDSGAAAAPAADDAEFLRRAFLDLNGRIPTSQRATAFLESRDPDKRAKLIDELIADHDFGLHFARYWRDLIIKRDADKKTLPNETVFLQWLARQFNRNASWDKIVRTMLTAEGDEALAGETYFILANEDDKQPQPNKIVGTAAALFMGIQLQCAECHIHPMNDQWNQDDFWGLAAFFAGTRAQREDAGKGKGVMGTAHVTQKAGKGKGKNQGRDVTPGTIAIPDPRNDGKTLGIAKAKLFETSDSIRPAEARRETAAEWLASPRDPYFAPAAVNRYWSCFFSRGLVNPLDDMRPDNKPIQPELLELLANEFTASGYDVKHLVHCLCLTQAYQRTSKNNGSHETDENLFARMPVKVLTPEMLFDSLAIATGDRSRRDEKGEYVSGQKGSPFEHMKRAEFFDTREYDENLAEYTFGIPQILRLMNRELNAACDEAAKKLPPGAPRDKNIEKLYLAALSRKPRPEEVTRMTAFLTRQKGAPAKGYANVLWALLNSAEFMCNR